MIKLIRAFDETRTAKARKALLDYAAKHPMSLVFFSPYEIQVLRDAEYDARCDRDALAR